LQVGMCGGKAHPARDEIAPYFYCVGFSATGAGDIRSTPGALPVLSKSIQIVLLPHTLEFTDGVEILLEEVRRVLSDDGQVVMLGHNPYSLRTLTQWRAGNGGVRAHALSWTRARLQGHGFSISSVRRYGAGWPRLSGRLEQDRKAH